MQDHTYYATRRLNPFEGVLQVFECGDARAFSTNGRVWQLQILTERPNHTWRSFSNEKPIKQFFNFGFWDSRNGMSRIPANPIMDIGAMTRSAEHLVECLADVMDKLPFPLIDNYEYWATSYQGEPIALLASTHREEHIPDIQTNKWHATTLTDHSFIASIEAKDDTRNAGHNPRKHAEMLECQVRQLGQHRFWFHRQPDGSGIRLVGKEKIQLPADAFPHLFLKTRWPSEQQTQLAQDYIHWLAAHLLTLQHLDDEERKQLEEKAVMFAQGVASQYRLYPKILDEKAIEAARVEARIRKAASAGS